MNREFVELADDFVTLGLLPAGSDRNVIVPALTEVFSEAIAGGVSNISFGQLSGNLGRTMYQYSFRIPAYYTLLVRSLTVLEAGAQSACTNDQPAIIMPHVTAIIVIIMSLAIIVGCLCCQYLQHQQPGVELGFGLSPKCSSTPCSSA